MMTTLLLLFLLPPAPEPPVELGKVPWLRNLDEGLAQARKAGQPVFLLFDEVPG